jgi:hypothetical protein
MINYIQETKEGEKECDRRIYGVLVFGLREIFYLPLSICKVTYYDPD